MLFCGSDLPPNLWKKLDEHFNKESEDLEIALDSITKRIEKEKEKVPNLIKVKDSHFYSNFADSFDALMIGFSEKSRSYLDSLSLITKQITDRKKSIFTPCLFDEPKSFEDDLNMIQNSLEILINQSNAFTTSRSSNQSQAKENLRLNDVYRFITDINYYDECEHISSFEKDKTESLEIKENAQSAVDTKLIEIKELKSQLKDESKGADYVNDYLNNFFGHKSLSLKPIKEDSNISSGYRFEVVRDSKKAFHLSEGERSLIAFCYFMAKLQDIETKGNKPIIWIDDPISSLDANHIFFIYSIINAEIVDSKKNEGVSEEDTERFQQLFISTHNLDFLKYLKRLPGALNKKISQYFIITRTYEESNVSLMPEYLKNYVTEFNFLFHQIYKCANAEVTDNQNHDCYYSFGNNARKFLEAFLYYKYPNANINDNDKLSLFFGKDKLSSSLIDRISNEYSHLEGIFERSIIPIDVPEMKTTATFILDTIKAKDNAQYTALLESIGETEKC